MAVSNEDLARLIVTLEVTTTKFYNGMRKAQQQTNQVASGIESRLTTMSSRIDKTFANLGQRLAGNITGPLAGIGAAFSTREIIKYADTWTSAGNQIRAAGQIVGLQGRPLEQIRQLADESRASFSETVTLYSRLLRAAGGVANSELEIAKATNIVNKAFKAGGSATSEMQAGIIQLSQGLSSGILAGDELRSVRENAPVLAKVIADYFKTTVGGLKELGAQGKLTSEEVFKAILSGEDQINKAFGTTNATISDSFLKIENALIQYIGSADHSNGVTVALTSGLSALADNFDATADVALKLASIIAGILVGRSMVALVGSLGQGVNALKALSAGLILARQNGASFGSVLKTFAGPLALIVGGAAAFAFEELASQSAKSAANIKDVNELATQLNLEYTKTTAEIRASVAALDDQTEATKRLKNAQSLRDSQKAVQSESDLRGGTFSDNAASVLPVFATDNADLKSAFAIYQRTHQIFLDGLSSDTDKYVVGEVQRISQGLKDSTLDTQAAINQLNNLNTSKVSQGVLNLLDSASKVAVELKNSESVNVFNGNAAAINTMNQQLIDSLKLLRDAAVQRANFTQDDGEIALVKGLDSLIDNLIKTDQTADQTRTQLNTLSGLSPSFDAFINPLSGLIDQLVAATVAAANAKAELNSESTPNKQAKDLATFKAADYGSLDSINAGKKYLAEQDRLLSMSERQRDLEAEILKIRKEANGAYIPESELTRRANARLDQKESDKKSSSSKTPDEKYSDNLDKERRANELLEAEFDLRSKLNPLVNDHGYQLAFLEKQQELLNQAKEKDIVLSQGQIDAINGIATAYATGKANLDQLEESQNKVRDAMQEWVDLGKSATRGFIDDLIQGKSAAEAFGNVLSQLANKLIDLGLDSIFGGGGGDFGLVGQLFNFGKVPGRAGGGNVHAGQPYVVGEKRPELFVPNENGTIIPKLPGARSSSGNVNAPVNINIDATGADAAGLARLETKIVQLKSELPYMIRNNVSNRAKKGW